MLNLLEDTYRDTQQFQSTFVYTDAELWQALILNLLFLRRRRATCLKKLRLHATGTVTYTIEDVDYYVYVTKAFCECLQLQISGDAGMMPTAGETTQTMPYTFVR
jgi:hypothetical protein